MELASNALRAVANALDARQAWETHLTHCDTGCNDDNVMACKAGRDLRGVAFASLAEMYRASGVVSLPKMKACKHCGKVNVHPMPQRHHFGLVWCCPGAQAENPA